MAIRRTCQGCQMLFCCDPRACPIHVLVYLFMYLLLSSSWQTGHTKAAKRQCWPAGWTLTRAFHWGLENIFMCSLLYQLTMGKLTDQTNWNYRPIWSDYFFRCIFQLTQLRVTLRTWGLQTLVLECESGKSNLAARSKPLELQLKGASSDLH